MEVERRYPKQGFTNSGKAAKLAREQPAAYWVFKNELLSMFFCCTSAHFKGLITNLLNSNMCMNKWIQVLHTSRQLCGWVNKICPSASQQLHFLSSNWIINWSLVQEATIIAITFLCYPRHWKDKTSEKSNNEFLKYGVLSFTTGFFATELRDLFCGHLTFPLFAPKKRT